MLVSPYRPFVVFSLPRSRSTWLSVFLSRGTRLVGHDIAVDARTPDDFANRLKSDLCGTCETGAAFAWPLIRDMLPDAAFVVIRRDPGEVTSSLERFGLRGYGAEMERRADLLDQISMETGAPTFEYEALKAEGVCKAIYEWCLQSPFDEAWWRMLAPINIQVDMPTQLAKLVSNHARLEGLKAEVERRLAHA